MHIMKELSIKPLVVAGEPRLPLMANASAIPQTPTEDTIEELNACAEMTKNIASWHFDDDNVWLVKSGIDETWHICEEEPHG